MWRPVVGLEGRYEVSDSGQVRNTKRGNTLTPQKYPNGYLWVRLAGQNKLIHRLVAEVFIPGDKALQVNHKDGDRANNAAANLEWMTCSDNHRHSYRELSRKQHAKQRKVFLLKGETVMKFNSCVEAARALGVVPGSIASAATKGHACRGYGVVYG